MREISFDEARSRHGITTHHHEMDNGELRFRLKHYDGTAYVRTEAGRNGAWQQSHYHKYVRETYIVQKGWVAYATKTSGAHRVEIWREGELFTTSPTIIHAVYMSANSVIHTVKHGESSTEDRDTTPETVAFDQLFVGFDKEEEILKADSRTLRR